MQNFYKRILIDLEFALIGVYVLGLIAAIATGEGILRTFGIPPTFVAALSLGNGLAFFAALVLYFLTIFFLPIISIVINRKKYLAMNIGLIIAAVASAYSFFRFFLAVLWP